ncbi:class I SAM-dependent methyltransferase [Thalassotalea litorea]|uniref:Class I SAM-dependent methyltransferase n=1 Tax=Thalassotalea litorea TaxID=2020715 RepID=A0A5R9ILN9_9GAMM|nr:class I SAM-dependent methyltransferase [Thalassotalea litorea]TLU66192.1 class I SAM-dependent methyltransferase [Thalassotalea litorea]
MSNREHWQQVFSHKQAQQMSWSQTNTDTAYLAFERLNLNKSAYIVEAGCGISDWSKHALQNGYQNLTLIDISKQALQCLEINHRQSGLFSHTCKYQELDLSAPESHWQSTALNTVDCWIDRAVFHFMTEAGQRKNYINKVATSLKKQGYWVLATFAENGPQQCSNLPVQRYSHQQLIEYLDASELGPFQCVEHWQQDHITPWGGQQSFNWWIIQRR